MIRKCFRIFRFLLGVANLAALASMFVVKVDALEPSAHPSSYFAYLAKLQLGPAVMSADLAVIAVIAILTLIAGRFYCEVMCPLGVAQDVIRKLSFRKAQGVRRVCCRLPVSKPQLAVRLTVLVAAAVLSLCGCVAYAWIDPYAVFGRAMTLMEPFVFSMVAVQVFVGKGRIWCNWICPVGTILAGLARFSYGRAKTTFDAHCKDCRACFPKNEEEQK